MVRRFAAAVFLSTTLAGCAQVGTPTYKDAVFADRWTATDGATIDYFLLQVRDTTGHVVLREALRRNGTWKDQWVSDTCEGASQFFLRLLNHHYDLMQAREAREDTAPLREGFRRVLDEDLAPCWSDRAPD